MWIDRFEVFEPGKRAVAVKNVTLAEQHLHDYCPALPTFPACLIIEGMAQTAGILVGQARGFKEKVILAKIKRATFSRSVRAGEQLRYEARIEHIDDAAAITSGVVRCGEEQIGRIELVFSHADRNLKGLKLPEENFVFNEQFMSLYRSFWLDKDQGGSDS